MREFAITVYWAVFYRASAYWLAKTSMQAKIRTYSYSYEYVRIHTDTFVRDVPVSDENGLTYRHSYFHRTVAQSF